MEQYATARNSPMELCLFGFQYGLVEIVAFCYCSLKISLEINEVINGYFKIVNSTVPEFCEKEGKYEKVEIGIPILHQFQANDGLMISTLDKFTEGRRRCMNYLLRMKKFSKYSIQKKNHQYSYWYRIVDKYISDYSLLDVQ